MAKKYSAEHIAKIYGVPTSRIEKWYRSKYGIIPTEILAADNTDIARHLGVQAISLKGNIVSLPAKSKRPVKKLKPTLKLIPFRGYVDKILEKPYRELAQDSYNNLSNELKQNREENKNLIRKLDDAYKSLPFKEDFQKNHCVVKYITWHDIEFNKDGYRVDPNILLFSQSIDGPTKILKDLDLDYFIKKEKNPLFKAYVHKKSGKVIEELSPDLYKISESIRDYLETKITVSGVHKKPISSNKEVNLSETESATRQYIDDHFSSNPYIMHLSEMVLRNGHATALWENNNDTPEESILFVTKSKNHTYAIWENIYPSRACYVFKFPGISKGANKKVRKLIGFINGTLINKRLSLFHNELDYEDILEAEDYYTLTHSDVKSYEKRIYELVPHLLEV